jgi:hypothetical protein
MKERDWREPPEPIVRDQDSQRRMKGVNVLLGAVSLFAWMWFIAARIPTPWREDVLIVFLGMACVLACAGVNLLLVGRLRVLRVCLAIVAPVIWLLVFPMIPDIRGRSSGGPSCMSNTRQVGVGLMLYRSDNDDLMPDDHWMDAIYPYTKSEWIIKCISLKSGYGKALANGMLRAKISENETGPPKLMLFESTDLTRNAVQDPNTFAARHAGHGYAVFSDSSVKSFTGEDFARAFTHSAR